MKYLDKFLKILKTDRNTFFTYILTLLTIYVCVDRVVEILFMCFTGISVSYWGPFQYTFALACPVFAFLFSSSSKFASDKKKKLTFFYLYAISLYIIGISMLTQWLNKAGWLLLLSAPNYIEVVLNFRDLIKPAFTAISCYVPLVTFFTLFKFLYFKVDDVKDIKDSITDYTGINLSDNKEGWGPYTCEIALCKDSDNGKIIKTPEAKRFEATLVVGVSGSGKTSMVFEPMIARDIEKKCFFTEAAKEMGYTALKTGIATLNTPYSNEYINENFSLNMLTPISYKEKIYKTYMKKLIYHYDDEHTVYKNLGITYVAPDYESIEHMVKVAKNYHVKYHLIDPNNPDSIGLNPFVYKDPIKTSIAISSVLKRMYDTSNIIPEEAFMQNFAFQAIENLSLLLKEVYLRRTDNALPTLEDLLKLFNNFSLIEKMCEEMKKDEYLSEQYSIQIGYCEKNFYRNGVNRENAEKYIQAATSQLETLLRYPGVKSILCNRYNNLDYDKVLKNGEVVFVCTRRGDLGAITNKAFGLFFLLLMQHSVLSRPGNEKTRIPHFLYIDEFPTFVCRATEDIFTLYRKYRVGTIISAQNLSQFGKADGDNYRQTIVANCSTKMVFGNNTPEDNAWWEKDLGEKREWKFKNDYNTKDGTYDQKYKDIEWAWKANYKAGKIQGLKFKALIYKTKDLKGKNIVGAGKVDFLESKYKEKQKIKTYNFAKFTNGIQTEEDKMNSSQNRLFKNKFDLKNINFNNNPENPNDMDPIQTNITDSKYFFDNEDAISFKLGTNKHSDTTSNK